jgi:hypothetical protein
MLPRAHVKFLESKFLINVYDQIKLALQLLGTPPRI